MLRRTWISPCESCRNISRYNYCEHSCTPHNKDLHVQDHMTEPVFAKETLKDIWVSLDLPFQEASYNCSAVLITRYSCILWKYVSVRLARHTSCCTLATCCIHRQLWTRFSHLNACSLAFRWISCSAASNFTRLFRVPAWRHGTSTVEERCKSLRSGRWSIRRLSLVFHGSMLARVNWL